MASSRALDHPGTNSVRHHRFDARATRRWRERLLFWYDSNRRNLPWRRNLDPYRIWISEIMLQQTRVSAVLDHYGRFLQRFPTLQKLAAARESSVLAAWSGLGYYRRARMMHAAAKTIVQQHGGRFPQTMVELRALPGIGRYTAAAIASIVFDAPTAVVDGNVERVLGRVYADALRGESLWQAAEELLHPGRPGDFNQAMMELGATVCLPRQPKCPSCPVSLLCATRKDPALREKAQATKSIRQRRREICYALDRRGHSIFLVQRPKHAPLMPAMWELPEIPVPPGKNTASFTLRHSITVTDYTVRVISGPLQHQKYLKGRWMPKVRIPRLPLTGLARKILREAQII